MKRGVNVVIMDNRMILIMKRGSNTQFSPGLWDFPGGKVHDKETLLDAVRREVKEESGLEIEPEENYFYAFPYPNGDITIYAFRARVLRGKVLLNEEHTEYQWVSQDNWQNFSYTPSTEATLKELFKR